MNRETYSGDQITEPLLKKLEALVEECLAAGVDADWILNAVESAIFGTEEVQ